MRQDRGYYGHKPIQKQGVSPRSGIGSVCPRRFAVANAIVHALVHVIDC